MSKARTLANFVSAGNPLSDGTIAASELTGTLAVANGGTGQTTYTDGQVLIGNTTGNTLTKASLTAGTGITITPGAGSISIAANNAGTVTSVTGTSPVASSGGATPAISLTSGYGDTLNPYASKTANFVLAAPNGSAGVPTFRAVDAADIPTLNQNTTGNAATATSATSATTSTNIAGGSNGTIPYQSASGTTQMLAAGTSGYLLKSNGAAAPSWVAPSAGGFSNMQVFTSSTSWTVPTGVSKIKVIITAGGGGAGTYSGSGGGGAGSTLIATVEVTAGWSLSITVGSGGTAYTQGGNSQILYSSPAIYLYAGGGIGSADSRDGGNGGTAANYSSGGPTIVSMLIRGGGGGGGYSDGGVGGSSYWGGGGLSGYNTNGSGLAYGSGGGGRGQNGAGSSSGADGVVVIEY
jgi:hypothetical protein